MKKYVLLTLMSLCGISLPAQIRNFSDIPAETLNKLDSMGIDSDPVLNRSEGDYFNAVFKDSRGDFDFTGKKVGFITGSNGRTLSDKKKYFDIEKDRFTRSYSTNNGTLHIFDAAQKEESGGYDAAIVSWCMVLRSANDAVKILNGQNVRKFGKR